MRALLLVVVLCAAGWTAYTRYEAKTLGIPATELPGASHGAPAHSQPRASDRYSCDGRTYCSQMTSCDEAKYFLAHCPGVKMDGDGDGIPCERQWCTEG